jgi:alpha-tubulin suppressor-like RCC1 family protein
MQPMRIFSYGRNDKGTLGQGHYRPPGWEPCREVVAADEVFVWACAGRDNTAFLTQSGKLLLSGSNGAYLFCDRVSRGREQPTMPDILAGRSVSRVYFGSDATHIFAVIDGHLHGWGRVPNALGIDTRSPTMEPKPVENVGSATRSGGIGAEQLKQLVLSTGHTIALLQDGTLVMSGGNARGQLGIGAKNNPYEVHVFTAPDHLAGLRFRIVGCSTLHSAAITEAGELFTTGRNDSGELGHDRLEDHFRFTHVTSGSVANKPAVQVACCDQSTLCLTADGMLHGAGSNKRGELGHGDLDHSSAFVQVPIPGGRTVKQVSAGRNHVVAWCHDGSLFSWGDNNYGQVTPGEKSRFVTTPTSVAGFESHDVLGVSCGEHHVVVMVA